jgi:hypothetical protein
MCPHSSHIHELTAKEICKENTGHPDTVNATSLTTTHVMIFQTQPVKKLEPISKSDNDFYTLNELMDRENE